MGSPTAYLMAPRLAVPWTRAPGRHGRIAAGNFDEDAVTSAVEAAQASLAVLEEPPTALLVASVSSPFAEGGIGQIVAEACGLGSDLLILEFGGSVAAGGAAIIAGTALLDHPGGPVLLVSTDARRDRRGRALGDGALAVSLVGQADRGHVAAITHVGSRAELVRDRWRLDGESGVTDADRSLLGVRPTGDLADVLAAHGEDPIITETDRPHLAGIGVLGTPAVLVHGLLGLAAARSVPLGVSAAGVRHGFVLTPGPAASSCVEHLEHVMTAGIDAEWPKRPQSEGFDPYASEPRSWRERSQDLGLEGQRDPATGDVLFPPVPAASAPTYEPYRLERTGTVLTCTRDHVFPYGGPLTMAVVEVDGGGRFYGQVADGRTVAIGDRVELVMRRLHDGGGLPQYFWKIRPTTAPDAGE